MSGPRRLLHPGHLRKLAMFSIAAGLVMLFVLHRWGAFPLLVGAGHLMFEPNDPAVVFIPLVDGLFVLGLLAHLTAIAVVLVERNAGIFSRRRQTARPSAAAAGPRQTEMPPYEPETPSYNQEPTASYSQPPAAAPVVEPLGVRLRAVWGEVRETMRSRRGPEPDEPETPAAPRQLGAAPVNTLEDDDGEH